MKFEWKSRRWHSWFAWKPVRLTTGEMVWRDSVDPEAALGLIVETLDRIEADCHLAVREGIARAGTSTDAPRLR